MRQQKQQKIYESILLLFRKNDYHSYSLLTEDKMIQILNSQAQRVIGEDFEERILEDIWERCSEKTEGDIQVITVAETFVEAINILKNRTESLKGDHGLIADRKTFLQDKKYELSLYEEETEIGNKHIFQLQNKIASIKDEIEDFEYSLNNFTRQMRLIETILLGDERVVLTQQKKEEFLEEESKHLRQIFYLTSLCILLEIYILQFRLSLLTTLCYLASFFILFVGYLHVNSVLYLELALALSILLDTIFTFMFAELGFSEKQSSLPKTLPLESIFIIFMIITLIGRGVIMWKWRRFTEITKKSFYFVIWGQEIKLNKRIVRIK